MIILYKYTQERLTFHRGHSSVPEGTFPLISVRHWNVSRALVHMGCVQSLIFIAIESETKGKGWSTVQIVLPIIIGVSLLATVAALFFCYRRRTLHRYERGNTTDSPRSRPFHRPFALKSSIQQVHSNTGDAHGKSWVIDNFESPMDRTSFDWEDGHVWLTPSPISPQTHVAHGFQHYVTQLWRNPFKRKVVKVESLPPRQGFRVDDADLSTLASNPGHPAGDGGRGHRNGMVKNDSDGWSMVEAEEVFDARDDGLDERSVLLISQSPGVDFSLESIRSPTPPADVSVIRPSQDSNPPISPQSSRRIVTPTSPYSVVYPRKQPADTIPPAQTSPTSPQSTGHLTTTSRNPLRYRHDPSTETLIRPPRTDPVMLFPPSVRAAGYNGVTNPYSSHSRDVSSDSQLASAVPMTHVSMP